MKLKRLNLVIVILISDKFFISPANFIKIGEKLKFIVFKSYKSYKDMNSIRNALCSTNGFIYHQFFFNICFY